MDELYTQQKPMLFGLAYRMLGGAADAEDIVHDVFAQYMALDPGRIENARAYLAKMTANRCINVLNSSRRKREQYAGPWLPEPLADNGPFALADPAERREDIGYAYLVLLQQLSPLERAVYLLKETLGFEYRDIAGMLDRTELSCRKTFSRAKGKMGLAASVPQQEDVRRAAKEQFVDAFLRASDTGDFKPLIALLLDEVTLVSDGGGKVRAAHRPIVGIRRVGAFFEGLAAKGAFRSGFKPVRIHGEPGLVKMVDGRVTMVLCPEWEPDGSRIRSLYLILNPDKLIRFIRNSPDTSPFRLRSGSMR
nr:sigma factor [Cohnella sp. CFH 77786]